MKQEATFAVVIPSGGLSQDRQSDFIEVCNDHCIEILLPMESDYKGNSIVSRGLSLQDAQILRRQISGLGFPVDVISDASQYAHATAPVEEQSLDTLVVELEGISSNHNDEISDITGDAWSSLEMEGLDLGLNHGGVESDKSKWSGDSWMKLNDSSSTLSLSAKDLIKAASSDNLKKVEKAQEELDLPPLVVDIQPLLPEVEIQANAGFSADLPILEITPKNSSTGQKQAPTLPVSAQARQHSVSHQDSAETLSQAPTQELQAKPTLGSRLVKFFLVLIAIFLTLLILLIIMMFFVDIPFLKQLLL